MTDLRTRLTNVRRRLVEGYRQLASAEDVLAYGQMGSELSPDITRRVGDLRFRVMAEKNNTRETIRRVDVLVDWLRGGFPLRSARRAHIVKRKG